jgi:hypothetical protein
MEIVRSTCPLLRRGDEVIGGEPIFMILRNSTEADPQRRPHTAAEVRRAQFLAQIDRVYDRLFSRTKPDFSVLFSGTGRTEARGANGRFTFI